MSLDQWLRNLRNGIQNQKPASKRGRKPAAGKRFSDSLQIEILENKTLLSQRHGEYPERGDRGLLGQWDDAR
jgi:hypothetical protein